MNALSITVLPSPLDLLATVLASSARTHLVATGRQLTTDHLKEEDLPGWGRVLVVYDEPATAGPGREVPVPARAPRPVDPNRPTPLVLARLPAPWMR